MKSFRFTLEALRTLRQRQEQKAMERYAKMLLARRQTFDALDAAHRELSACWQEWREKMAAGCTAADGTKAQEAQRVLSQRRDECAHALQTAERRVNAALQAMLLARRQREIVDKYCEQQKARHRRELARGDQKFLDDIAGRRGNSLLSWKAAESPL